MTQSCPGRSSVTTWQMKNDTFPPIFPLPSSAPTNLPTFCFFSSHSIIFHFLDKNQTNSSSMDSMFPIWKRQRDFGGFRRTEINTILDCPFFCFLGYVYTEKKTHVNMSQSLGQLTQDNTIGLKIVF